MLGGLVLAGCASLAPPEAVPAIVSDIPEEFAASAELGLNAGDYEPANWWRAFEDPVLDTLVGQALASNLDIVEAAGRLEQVSAQARIARSGLLPAVNASADGSSSSTPVDGLAFGGIAGGALDRIENESYSAGLGVSYELDLFGRVRGDAAAAQQDAIATAFDLQTVQLSAAAETISAYFDFVDARRQIELTRRTAEVLEDRAQRSEERFSRGLIESFELYQVQQDLRATQASIPQLESGLVTAQGRLALLVGRYPEQLTETLAGDLRPRLVFEDVPTGLPIELLSQRPDVAAAAARLEAERLRIGARRAERFPTISLTGSFGTQGGTPDAILDVGNNWAASLASSITAPIFNAGRISANIRSARALYDQRAAAYARTVLTAYSEVQSAVIDYELERRRYRLIADQLRTASASFELQRQRFAAGVGSYTAYLDALRTVYQVEGNLSSAARSTALARLGVHRALAGDWAFEAQSSELPMRDVNPQTTGETP